MEGKVSTYKVLAECFKGAYDMLQQPAFVLLKDYMEGAYQRSKEGGAIAWTNFAMPPELFWAMDVYPVVVDLISGFQAGWNPGRMLEYIDLAHEYVPDYVCANNKAFLGVLLSKDLDPPDIFVVPSNPCDANLSAYPAMSRLLDLPYHVIGTPYFGRSERAIEYMASEWLKLISVLEEMTKRKLDLDKLRQVIRYSNVAHDYSRKLGKLRQNIPCPQSSSDMFMDGGLLMAMAGTPQLVDYFKMQYETVKAKAEAKDKPLTDFVQRIRLVWSYGSIAFDPMLLPWMEQEFGAISVCAYSSNWLVEPWQVQDNSDLHDMVRHLARKMVMVPMTRECHGPWENFSEATIDMARRYHADAVIFGGHVACKSSWAIAKLVKDRIYDVLGIPTMNVELDMFDSRVASSDQLKATFTEFLTVNFPKS